MKNVSFVVAATAALFAASASFAQTAPAVQEQARVPERGGVEAIDLFKHGKKLDTVACRDFNMLDESLRPQAVVYAANYGPKGKAHPTLTVDDVANVVPVVVNSCSAQPGNHFAATVRAALRTERMHHMRKH